MPVIPDKLADLSDVTGTRGSGKALIDDGTNFVYTPAYSQAQADTLLAAKASTGSNTFTGSQTVPSGQSFIATNSFDWQGVAITGTGLTGKDTSNNTTWSIASATGNIRGARYQSMNGNFDWQDSTNTLSLFIIRSNYHRAASTGNTLAIADDNKSSASTALAMAGGTWTHSSGTAIAALINPTDSTTGTGGLTALQTQISGSGSGSGSKLHYVAKNAAGTTVASIDSSGNFVGQRYTAGSCALGTNDVIVPQVTSTGNNVSLNLQGRSFTSPGNAVTVMNGASVTNSTGKVSAFAILPTINSSGSAVNTDLLINRTQSAVGSGAQMLADFQVGSSSKHSFDNTGAAIHAATISPGTYTVATLPTAGTARRMAWASNGRKNGEGAGAGTGVPVFDDGTAWRAVDTGATVAA